MAAAAANWVDLYLVYKEKIVVRERLQRGPLLLFLLLLGNILFELRAEGQADLRDIERWPGERPVSPLLPDVY